MSKIIVLVLVSEIYLRCSSQYLVSTLRLKVMNFGEMRTSKSQEIYSRHHPVIPMVVVGKLVENISHVDQREPDLKQLQFYSDYPMSVSVTNKPQGRVYVNLVNFLIAIKLQVFPTRK